MLNQLLLLLLFYHYPKDTMKRALDWKSEALVSWPGLSDFDVALNRLALLLQASVSKRSKEEV